MSLVNSFQAHTDDINRIKQSPFNTNYVATSSNDITVKIWSVSSSLSWTLITTYSQHSSCVEALEWLDKDTLASGSRDLTSLPFKSHSKNSELPSKKFLIKKPIFVLQRYLCYKYLAMCYEVFLMCYNSIDILKAKR